MTEGPKIVYKEELELRSNTRVRITVFDTGHAILSSDGDSIGINIHLNAEQLKSFGCMVNRVMDYVDSH